MTPNARSVSRYQSLRTSRRVLGRIAPLVRYACFCLGVSLFLERVGPLVSDAQFTWGERRVLAIVALVTLGGWGLAGWVAGRLLKASAEMIDVFIDGAEAAWRAADLIELQLVPTLGRIANALERSPIVAGDAASAPKVAAARRAIADHSWEQAETHIEALAREEPTSSEAATLTEQLRRARDEVVSELRAGLESGREANEPERVIEARDALTQHLRGAALAELDQKTVRWLWNLIQKRIQAGRVDGELTQLAARVSDSFGDTPEGARLRAALPDLRRTAGLCPRCGRPFRGSDEACPRCRNAGTEAPAPAPGSRSAPVPRERR